MYIKTTDSNKKNNVSWPEERSRAGLDPFGCDSTQFVHLTAFIFIIFTFASRSQHAPQIITTIIRTHCARRAATTTPVVMAMSRTGQQQRTALDSRVHSAAQTLLDTQNMALGDSVHCATRCSSLFAFTFRFAPLSLQIAQQIAFWSACPKTIKATVLLLLP